MDLRLKLIMTNFKRGDVVLADLGYLAKVRPALVVSISKADSQRNMTVIAPLTTEIRDGECEVAFPKPAWLKQDCVVNLIGLIGVDNAKILRRLSAFPGDMADVDQGLKRLFDLP
ncbi:MAG: type II toxin-antitoxin system PemK/MazF family toxin [Verrucomicrobiota bacterium]